VKNHFVQFDEPEVVTFRTRDTSPSAGPGQALLRTRYSVISPGTELARFHGTVMPNRNEEALKYPMLTGSAIVGEVMETSDAARLPVGARVVASRPHALYNTIGLDDTNGWARIPEGMSDEDAALAVFLKIGLTAALCVDVKFGQRVLVLGQGLIGYCGAQWFNRTPALEVIATDLLESRVAFAREHGTDARPAAEVAELARKQPFDIVVEATGAPAAVLEAFECVREGGAVILLGTPRGTLANFDVTNLIHRPPVMVFGAHGGTHGMNVVGAPGLAIKDSLAVCVSYITRGRVRVDGLIGATFAPSEVAAAFAAVDKKGLYTVGLDWRRERFEE
jgi:threonine dehydrogenase-like Zn-dependent dehydrogenase